MTHPPPAAGWYADPWKPANTVRYWNGTQWTPNVQPMPPGSTPVAPQPLPISESEPQPEAGEPLGSSASTQIDIQRDKPPLLKPAFLLAAVLVFLVALVGILRSQIVSSRSPIGAQSAPSTTSSSSAQPGAEVSDTEAGLMKLMFLCLEASVSASMGNPDFRSLTNDDQSEILRDLLAKCGDRYVRRLGDDWTCNSTGCSDGTQGVTWSEASKVWIRVRDELPADMRAPELG